MLGHRVLSIDDYLAILRRRWYVILVPAILGPVIAYGVSLKLPSRFTSQTLILVEGQKVPDSYVKSVITEDLISRLGAMEEQILSRTRLAPIIERFGLYSEDRGRVPVEDLVDRVRKSLLVAPVRPVVRPGEGPEASGFTISFTADTPRLAQQVCSEITSMFIGEGIRRREQSAQDTTSFLQSQLDDAKRKLDEQDAKLAQFKRKYLGALPDNTQTNLNLLSTWNTQFEAVTEALNRAQQDKAYTESLLAQQVAAWESLKSGHNPHPETVEQQLVDLENTLAALQARYTNNHPDVIKLKAAIEQLRKKARESNTAVKDKPAETEEDARFEPPQITRLRDQIHLDQQVIQERTHEQGRLQEQIRLYQARVQLSPAVEQEYRAVTRDYQTALEFYNDLLKKKDQSAMATDLERRQQGEQFRVMDPANLPEKPSFPDRPMFAAAGFGGGLALGLALTLLLEFRDKSIRTESDVEFYLRLPTLASVPAIGNTKRRVWRGRPRKRVAEQARL